MAQKIKERRERLEGMTWPPRSPKTDLRKQASTLIRDLHVISDKTVVLMATRCLDSYLVKSGAVGVVSVLNVLRRAARGVVG